MRTICKTVYRYDGLEEESKERVVKEFSEGIDYLWDRENVESLEEFESRFPITVMEWSVDPCGNSRIDWKFTECGDVDELRGIRLMKYLWNNYWEDIYSRKYVGALREHGRKVEHRNVESKWMDGTERWLNQYFSGVFMYGGSCPWTGYFMDDVLLSPIVEFMDSPVDGVCLQELLEECLNEWLEVFQRDVEYQYSREGIEDTIRVNEYEFYEDGSLV